MIIDIKSLAFPTTDVAIGDISLAALNSVKLQITPRRLANIIIK